MGNHVPEHEVNRRRAKSEIKRHWVGAGLWSDFVELRESIKGAGLTPDEAWQEADRRLRSGSHAETIPSAEQVSNEGQAQAPVELLGQVGSEAFSRETVSTAETVRWVASYLMVGDAVPEDAPSSEAWGMLQWAKRNNTNEAAFWSQIWRQLMPTKQSLEAETRFSDDGKPILELIDRITRIAEVSDESDTTVGS